MRQSFKNSFKVQVSQTLREKKTVTWKGVIDPEKFEPNEKIVLAKAYKRYSFDLYLVFIDYLIVEYRQRTKWAVVFKRTKSPKVQGAGHPNIFPCNIPLASLRFWRQLPDALLPIEEPKYVLEVNDELDIVTQDLVTTKKFPVKLPPPRTLYDLSEEAFPKKRRLGLW